MIILISFKKNSVNTKNLSLTPSKISIIIFFKRIPRFLSITRKILNLHVLLKKKSKIEDKYKQISIFFKTFAKIQKVKSNLHLQNYQLSYFYKEFQDFCLQWAK